MNDVGAVDILNDLLAAEQSNVLHRLMESTVFVSPVAIDDSSAVRRMAGESHEHVEWLTKLILSLGGSPGIRLRDLRTADLHFQELHHVLSRVANEHSGLIRRYALAVERLAPVPPALEVVSRVLERHQEHQALLEQLTLDGAGSTT